VLVDGGIACVNVGDATRTIDGTFRLFPNHVRVSRAFADLGFVELPTVRWRKPTNRGTKFMGSGMLPTNAYPTLEHEHILVFRNGSTRSFPAGDERRYESAYFWEERNQWFSDLWDVRGEAQDLEAGVRERSGAFPFAVPYRLIAMFSTYGDTVLDPFLGTGTTTFAAAVAGRNSVGYERDETLRSALDDRTAEAPARSRTVAGDRLRRHREWATQRADDGEPPGYESVHYDVPVMTKQERQIRLYTVEDVEATEDGFGATHVPIEETEAIERPVGGTEGA
jgi:site-specific DNA-methyltransferase (cytosine-N4-specific)